MAFNEEVLTRIFYSMKAQRDALYNERQRVLLEELEGAATEQLTQTEIDYNTICHEQTQLAIDKLEDALIELGILITGCEGELKELLKD